MSAATNIHVGNETVEEAVSWFRQFGSTDEDYLRAHWKRYLRTLDFVESGGEQGETLDILDIGSHWLHNAVLYAGRNHRLTCTDAPDLMGNPAVLAAADRMGVELRPMHRMEIGDSLEVLPDNSFDLVLFCEIIEHIAFNPIPFWKQVYRVLRPGGRIIITTPNSMYYKTVSKKLSGILSGRCFGNSVTEIMENGTYGHHWKEFSIFELKEYFSYLSSDFDTSRYEFITHDEDLTADLGAVERHIGAFTDVRAYNIYLDVRLAQKAAGVTVNPPWIPL